MREAGIEKLIDDFEKRKTPAAAHFVSVALQTLIIGFMAVGK
ncbi:hypothetical protein [Edaphobacter aggregans]|nr:hypothetical protein [Edaphobacter aggregans]